MQGNTLHVLACHAETHVQLTIPTISAIVGEKDIQLIVDLRATPGGGFHKNLTKKKLKKFFSGAGQNYRWDETLSKRSKTSSMTDTILRSHALRVLGNRSDVLVLVDRFAILHQLVAATSHSVMIIEFPDPSDVFSFTERPLNDDTDIDVNVRHARQEAEEKKMAATDVPSELQMGPQLEDVPRFIVGENFETEGRQFLKENGFVVVSNVLMPGDITYAEQLLWNHLEGLGSGIRRNDVRTWNNDNWPDRQPSGVVAWEGIGQSPFLWFVRTRPNVRRVFEIALESENLITSFDGCGLFRPWQYERSWKTKKSWLHVDQNPAFCPEFECLQGLITLKNADESTGGFMCIPKSNHEFLNFYERHRNGSKRMQKAFSRSEVTLVRLPETDPLMHEKKIVPRLFAGDMILWDSRTMHCNTHALDDHVDDEVLNRDVNEWDLIRIVTYVCFSTPEIVRKKRGDWETLVRQREHAVRNQITTNHMPFIYKPNGDGPMRKGTKSTLKTPPWPSDFELTEDLWRLVRGC